MDTLKLSQDLTLHTFDTPPAHFDYRKASDRERSIYGLPPASAVPEELERRWLRKLGNVRVIKPTFSPRNRKRRLPGASGPSHGPQTSSVWSGGIQFIPAGDSARWVAGTWTMPNVDLPPNARSGVTFTASTWVGIDGFGSPDVLQAGCDGDVELSNGKPSRKFRPWWEWFPAGSFWIDNLPVSAGDQLSCIVCVAVGSTTSASIYLSNILTQTFLNFSVTASSGTSLVGNCAEWIVEALETDGSPELARYSRVVFTECDGGTAENSVINASNSTTIDMVNSSNVDISAGEILGTSAVEVTYIG